MTYHEPPAQRAHSQRRPHQRFHVPRSRSHQPTIRRSSQSDISEVRSLLLSMSTVSKTAYRRFALVIETNAITTLLCLAAAITFAIDQAVCAPDLSSCTDDLASSATHRRFPAWRHCFENLRLHPRLLPVLPRVQCFFIATYLSTALFLLSSKEDGFGRTFATDDACDGHPPCRMKVRRGWKRALHSMQQRRRRNEEGKRV